MNIEKIIEAQRRFDKKHGWLPRPENLASVFKFLQTDTVGLCGEVGEIAGIVKTLGLESQSGELESAMSKFLPEIHEEVVDVLIYLIRIIDYLEIDVDNVYFEKLRKNESKFKKYEKQ